VVSESGTGFDAFGAVDFATAMPRIDCPHCDIIGRVSAERIIHAADALTTYYCDACRCEWDESDSGARVGKIRTRPPKTYKDKTE
jgi:hypothetical protein